MIIDTHAHLDFNVFDSDRTEIIDKAFQKNITKIVNIGVSLESSKQSIELANQYKEIYATVAVHPSETKLLDSESLSTIKNKLKKLSKNPRVVAIGECGLDYFHVNKEKIKKQKDLFEMQANLAKEIGLPLVIHSREAFDDVLDILKKTNFPMNHALFHSWTYSVKEMKQITKMGCYIAFNAIVTYPNATNIQESAQNAPLHQMVLETDAPFLPPQSKRGQRNEPSDILETAKKIADLRKVSFETIAKNTTENAHTFFQFEKDDKIG